MIPHKPSSLATFGCAVLLFSFRAWSIDDYQLGPDSQPHEGVPRGEVIKSTWTSKIYPGTVRDYWIYVPMQYDTNKDTCVMIFQDGGGYVSTNGSYRASIVFDNLIHKKEMPVTIGIFINPGVVPPPSTNALPRFNRSFEYDGLGPLYSRFLLEEILPEVGRKYRLATNATGRAIAGASSGAICAFTAAWERPDQFSRVFSTIGTYVGLRGGDKYPTLVRETEPKPIRVFLQDGSNDQNIYGGNWFLANQEMLSALQFAGYDVKNEWGDGRHSGKHGGAIFPDAVRWLWRDYPQPIDRGKGSQQPVMDVLLAAQEWELVGEGYGFTEGPAVRENGEVYFTDIPNNRIHKVGLDSKVSIFKEDSGGANGLMFGPDGKLYACENGRKRIVAYDMDGNAETIVDDIESNDLCVSRTGAIYVTDPGKKRVWLVDKSRQKRVVDTGISFPNGVRLTPDQSLLLVADSKGQFVYSFHIEPDGTLTNKQAYFHLHIPDGQTDSGADGMTFDTQGRLYVATRMGLQMCDQAGRVNGIILKPQDKWLAHAVFGGPEFDTIYAACSDKVFKRNTKARGVLSARDPIMPPSPRL